MEERPNQASRVPGRHLPYWTQVARSEGQVKTMTGAELRGLRETADCTLAEVATGIGVSESYVSKLESRSRPITPELVTCPRWSYHCLC
jgi:DNA-binding XRE family transcriptional regulator